MGSDSQSQEFSAAHVPVIRING